MLSKNWFIVTNVRTNIPISNAYQFNCRKIAYFQDKTLVGLSLAYGAIRASTASSYLGLGPMGEEAMKESAGDASPELIMALTKRGWVWEPESKIFYPKPGVMTPPISREEQDNRP